MGRPDWHAMLAGMISTEYADWHRFHRTYYLQGIQLDIYPSGLTYVAFSLFFCDPDMHPFDFGLLVPRHEEKQVERSDEDKTLVQKVVGPARGVRFSGDGGRNILSSVDVADVVADDAALTMVLAGIPRSVRYVPAGW